MLAFDLLKDSECGSIATWKNHSNAEVAFHIAVKVPFGQPKNLFDAAILLRIGHILNPCYIYKQLI